MPLLITDLVVGHAFPRTMKVNKEKSQWGSFEFISLTISVCKCGMLAEEGRR